MNSLHSVLAGLLSSLLLSVGFRQLAARYDTLNQASVTNSYLQGDQNLAATMCAPCRLPATMCAPCRWQEV